MTTATPVAPVQYQIQQQPLHSTNFDPHHIINMALGSMIAEQMANILKSSDGLTIGKISKMLTIMSMDEIRKSAMGYLKEFFNFVKTNHAFFKKGFGLIYDAIKSVIVWFKTAVLKMEQDDNNIEELSLWGDNDDDLEDPRQIDFFEPINSITVTVNAILPFMQILIEFVTKNPKYASYNVSDNHFIDIQDLEKIVVYENWDNILIDYNNLKIEINSKISMVFEQQRHKLNLIRFNNVKTTDSKKRTIDLDSITTLSDLIPDESLRKKIRAEVLKGYNKAYDTVVTYGSSYTTLPEIKLAMNFLTKHKGSTASGNYLELNLIEFLQSKMKNMNACSSIFELVYLLTVHKISNTDLLKLLCNNSKLKCITLFDVDFKVSIINNAKYFSTTPHVLIKNGTLVKMTPILDAYLKMEKIDKYDKFIDVTTEVVPVSNHIDFEVSSEHHQKKDLYQEFKTFVKSISAHIERKEIKEPVKSFVIMINEKYKTENIPNPDYGVYLKQKKFLDMLIKNCNDDNDDDNDNEIENPVVCVDDKTSKQPSIDPTQSSQINKPKRRKNTASIAQHGLIEFMRRPIPTETIEKITAIKEIIVSEVNDVYKSLNTLYLRKEDSEKLKNVLEMFYDGKAIMEEMGIPNKLGILLHGLHGTGKSSAIAAIATYLKKNIYCVDFKTIKTNSDFMLMVSHVNKHCVNGGILTFEDFDAMGSVLHRRGKKIDNSNDMNTISLHNTIDQPLTLDYILNVFQGSLTPSGFVFIATTNHLSVLDEALYRDGRFDIKIDMKLCDHYQIQCIFNKLMKRTLPKEIITRIKEDKWTPATIIFRVIHYIKGDHTDEMILKPFLEPSFDEIVL